MSLKELALNYHEQPKPGKTETGITKSTVTQQDLSLAYTPGVAEPCREIAKNPENAYRYTNRGNLIAVISNGTAVLGLGNLGALASKPVMEGKAVLFKKFADVDVFDIEIDATEPQHIIDTVKTIAPTFGGINLEDIKAPECFEVEQKLQELLDIPVFHDDQHGTAIVAAAGLLNALELQNKTLDTVKIVCIGAGAAGIACMRLFVELGAQKQNITLIDSRGVIHTGRNDLNKYKAEFAITTDRHSLAEAMMDADVAIGVSGPNLITGDMLRFMAAKPIIFAMSNPDPEINPALAHSVRDDLIMATGRSDYPNQINNVSAFPYIFRGALDARASKINTEMQIAAVHAIRGLVHQVTPQIVIDAYEGATDFVFGKDYIIPKPMDPRLLDTVAPAVKAAAIKTGVVRQVAEKVTA